MKKQRCPHCKELKNPHPDEWMWVRRKESTIHRKECKECATKAVREEGALIVSC